MRKFKKGLAVILSIMTAFVVITIAADGFIAIGGNLGFVLELASGFFTAIIAMPLWLAIITTWQVAHKKSYLKFKDWCLFQINDLTRA